MINVCADPRIGGLGGTRFPRCPTCNSFIKIITANAEVVGETITLDCENCKKRVTTALPRIYTMEPTDVCTIKASDPANSAYRRIGKKKQKLWLFKTVEGASVLVPKSVFDQLVSMLWNRQFKPSDYLSVRCKGEPSNRYRYFSVHTLNKHPFIKCPDCKGTGKAWCVGTPHGHNPSCPVCNGDGATPDERYFIKGAKCTPSTEIVSASPTQTISRVPDAKDLVVSY